MENSRAVVKLAHLRAGCPICNHVVDKEHEAAIQEDLARKHELLEAVLEFLPCAS